MKEIPDQLKIINYIKSFNGNRVLSDQIRDHFGIIEKHETNVKTRSLVRKSLDLAIEHRIPIGSDGKGYFLIKNQTQLDAFIKNMEGRIKGINTRTKKVIKAFQRSEIKEVNLFEIFKEK